MTEECSKWDDWGFYLKPLKACWSWVKGEFIRPLLEERKKRYTLQRQKIDYINKIKELEDKIEGLQYQVLQEQVKYRHLEEKFPNVKWTQNFNEAKVVLSVELTQQFLKLAKPEHLVQYIWDQINYQLSQAKQL